VLALLLRSSKKATFVLTHSLNAEVALTMLG